MREHNALGEARCTGCILHIADVILIYSRSHAIYLALGRLGSVLKSLLPCQTPLLLKTYRDYVTQERQTLSVELTALFDVFELGTQAGYDLAVAGILSSLSYDESMGIALL